MPAGRARPRLLLPALCALAAASPGAAYDLVLEDGRVLEVENVGLLDGSCALWLDGEAEPCPEDVDFSATLAANLDREGGNVVFFRTGGWLRFEDLEIEDDRARIHLGEDASITLSASVLDARRSVLEGATLELPPASARIPMVAKDRVPDRQPPTRTTRPVRGPRGRSR